MVMLDFFGCPLVSKESCVEISGVYSFFLQRDLMFSLALWEWMLCFIVFLHSFFGTRATPNLIPNRRPSIRQGKVADAVPKAKAKAKVQKLG